ncbi:NrdH-redoxin [Brevibacterium sp. CBA3109]|uniref:NrdH-redoxin n=1 Tax=Brevibacterium koreense TaxID=3140787 RepID=A0AAU7UNF7_9MICO
MSNITVWTAPQCGKCESTISFFKGAGFPPNIKDLSAPENLDKLKEIKAAGHSQAPYVETPTDSWSGLRPDKIAQTIAVERAAAPSPAVHSPSHSQELSA